MIQITTFTLVLLLGMVVTLGWLHVLQVRRDTASRKLWDDYRAAEEAFLDKWSPPSN